MKTGKIWLEISAKAEEDYAGLSEKERQLYSLGRIIEAVNGKGLMSLYESREYYYADDSVEDLYTAGLDEIAAIIESANAMFPGGCPAEEYEERLEIIDSWEYEFDELFDQWTDDILEFSADMERSYNAILAELE